MAGLCNRSQWYLQRCRAPRRVLFDARRFDALAFSGDSLPLARTTITDTSLRRADAPLKPVSPVSIAAACADESGNTRRFERKSNPRKGQRTARTRPAYIHNTDAYVKPNEKKTYPRIFVTHSSNVRANNVTPAVLPRDTSVFGLSLVTPHKLLSYTISIPYLVQP